MVEAEINLCIDIYKDNIVSKIWVSGIMKYPRKPLFYADNRTWTCTVSHQNLNLARLPIPPYPLRSERAVARYLVYPKTDIINHKTHYTEKKIKNQL